MQKALVQKIFNLIVNKLDKNWFELKIKFKYDETVISVGGSYLVDIDNKVVEKIIHLDFDEIKPLQNLFKDLRLEVGGLKGTYFSSCIYHMLKDGQFNLDYSYEKNDWSININNAWKYFDDPRVDKRDPK